MNNLKAQVVCPHCNESFYAVRSTHWRRVMSAIFAVVLMFLGFSIGATIGIATAGVGIAATVPLGIIGFIFGWYIGRDFGSRFDKTKCPKCGNPISVVTQK